MASSKKRPRSLTPEDDEEEEEEEEEEETHLKKYEIDLNKEPEPEDDDINLNKEAEDANQNEEHNRDRIDKEREEQDEIVTAAFALSHFMFLRDTTRDGNQPIVKPDTNTDEHDEEKEDNEIVMKDETNLKKETEHDKTLDSVSWLSKSEKERWAKKKKFEAEKEEWIKKRKIESKDDEEDDSDETFRLLRRWEIPVIPPEKIVKTHLIKQCSKPIRKQLTKKDVNGEEEEKQSRLGLSKSQVTKKFLPLLKETEIPRGKQGIRVSVYGPKGRVYEMKMWANEKKHILDLTMGWRKFVGDYELKEICDFITIWMFRHKESNQICFAIDTTRLSLRKQVSKRISKAVFDDSRID